MKIFIFLFLIIVLFINGCSDELTVVENNNSVREIVIMPSCDDVNTCTVDVFNERTQQCEHNQTETCCGDGVCTADERCNLTSHKTQCSQDCELGCPAFVEFSNWSCSNCNLKDGKYIFNGTSLSFGIRLNNIGETSVNNFKSHLICNKAEGGQVLSGNRASIGDINFNGKIVEGEDIYLSGEVYGKSIVNYKLDIDGFSTKNISLNCYIRFTGSNYYASKDLILEVVAVQ